MHESVSAELAKLLFFLILNVLVHSYRSIKRNKTTYCVLSHHHTCCLTLYHIIPTLKKNLWKTLWEKEKMLDPSIFSFSKVFSTPLKREFVILIQLNLSSANAFDLVKSKILWFDKGSNLKL